MSGPCHSVCDNDGAISWNHSQGGHGVVPRHS